MALGNFEEALKSFCICVALDRNIEAVRYDVAKVPIECISHFPGAWCAMAINLLKERLNISWSFEWSKTW